MSGGPLPCVAEGLAEGSLAGMWLMRGQRWNLVEAAMD